MKNAPLQAVIFDLDGVLTDTAELHFQAWKQLAEHLGIAFSRKENDRLRGVSRRDSLTRLLKSRRVTEEQAHKLMDEKNAYYRLRIKTLTPKDVVPGALAILQALKMQSIQRALASVSKNTPAVLERLNLTQEFEVIADGFSVEKHKPAPDIFLYCAQQLKVSPKRCVVVEDAQAGVQAAHAAGMKCIGIAATAIGADRTITSLSAASPPEFIRLAQELIT